MTFLKLKRINSYKEFRTLGSLDSRRGEIDSFSQWEVTKSHCKREGGMGYMPIFEMQSATQECLTKNLAVVPRESG